MLTKQKQQNVNLTTKWMQVFTRGREEGDTIATSTIWEQVGENRNLSAREKRQCSEELLEH